MTSLIGQKIASLEAELVKLKEQRQKSLLEKNINVLVVGSGGREHTIVWKISQSNRVGIIYFAPGNGGGNDEESQSIINVPSLKATDIAGIVKFSKANDIGLVVVGPEVPLVKGIGDELVKVGIPCFGPNANAAKIEASKAFSKDFMARNNIPTAEYKTFTDYIEAKNYIENCNFQVVIKASGLAAGKGVLIPSTKEEALDDLKRVMLQNAFGDAGKEIVIEERLEGEEASCMAFTDGVNIVALPAAQDHKRIWDNDRGLNTGGMGAYAPTPLVTPKLTKQIMEQVLKPTVDSLRNEGRPFVGVIYPGLMINKSTNTIKVLEYNCRLGDPETQVLLPLLKSDLLEIMLACTKGELHKADIQWYNGAAATVVAASKGYPKKYQKGMKITGLDKIAKVGELSKQQQNKSNDGKLLKVFHAGTKFVAKDLSYNTCGGRVLAVTARGKTLEEAVKYSYHGIRQIQFNGIQYRNDIGKKGLPFKTPLRLGVLGSTRGTDLQAIINAIQGGRLNATVEVVVSNKKNAYILTRATEHQINSYYLPCKKGTERSDYDASVSEKLLNHNVDLVLMIGYMRIVSGSFCKTWAGKLINVHPSLLPEFAGGMDLNVHEEVIKSGGKYTGCTVHLVTEEVDSGPIIIQKSCTVDENETVDTLKSKVQYLEGEALIESIRCFMDGYFPTVNKTKMPITYADAGVNIAEGNALIDDIKPHCKSTRRPGCNADLGGFGGLFDLKEAGFIGDDTVLVSCTDGVGTKLKVAQILGVHNTVGIDLVAMSVNDLIVQGAEPLLFLDYFACGSLERKVASEVVSGIAAGCRLSGCALIGGETAEMPGMYPDGEYDLAGFATGAVQRSKLLPHDVKIGYKLIGIPSSGLHSNGFSLVRKLIESCGLNFHSPCPFDPTQKLGEVLLEPTVIYVKECLKLFKLEIIEALAHITGGGLIENLPRVLDDNIKCKIDAASWKKVCPEIFQWIASLNTVPVEEMFRTFNCGIGMVLFVKEENVGQVLGLINNAMYIGEVVGRKNKEEEQIQIVGTPW
jgi:formyltetrahydrofolate-dependent phosphoribosylglycinamide formyltransferase